MLGLDAAATSDSCAGGCGCAEPGLEVAREEVAEARPGEAGGEAAECERGEEGSSCRDGREREVEEPARAPPRRPAPPRLRPSKVPARRREPPRMSLAAREHLAAVQAWVVAQRSGFRFAPPTTAEALLPRRPSCPARAVQGYPSARAARTAPGPAALGPLPPFLREAAPRSPPPLRALSGALPPVQEGDQYRFARALVFHTTVDPGVVLRRTGVSRSLGGGLLLVPSDLAHLVAPTDVASGRGGRAPVWAAARYGVLRLDPLSTEWRLRSPRPAASRVTCTRDGQPVVVESPTGRLMTSLDGGTSWRPVTASWVGAALTGQAPPTAFVDVAVSPDATTLDGMVAVSVEGRAYRYTAPRGSGTAQQPASWTPLRTEPATLPRRLLRVAVGARRVAALTEEGTLLIGDSPGVLRPMVQPEALTDVAFGPPEVLWALDRRGVLWRHQDGRWFSYPRTTGSSLCADLDGAVWTVGLGGDTLAGTTISCRGGRVLGCWPKVRDALRAGQSYCDLLQDLLSGELVREYEEHFDAVGFSDLTGVVTWDGLEPDPEQPLNELLVTGIRRALDAGKLRYLNVAPVFTDELKTPAALGLDPFGPAALDRTVDGYVRMLERLVGEEPRLATALRWFVAGNEVDLFRQDDADPRKRAGFWRLSTGGSGWEVTPSFHGYLEFLRRVRPVAERLFPRATFAVNVTWVSALRLEDPSSTLFRQELLGLALATGFLTLNYYNQAAYWGRHLIDPRFLDLLVGATAQPQAMLRPLVIQEMGPTFTRYLGESSTDPVDPWSDAQKSAFLKALFARWDAAARGIAYVGWFGMYDWRLPASVCASLGFGADDCNPCVESSCVPCPATQESVVALNVAFTGLLRADGTPKPLYADMRAAVAGRAG